MARPVTEYPENTSSRNGWQAAAGSRAYIRDLPVAEYGMVQLECGPETFSSQRVESAHAKLVQMRFGPRSTGYLVPGDGWTAILIPRPRDGFYRVNGQTVLGHGCFVISSRLGCHAIGAMRDNLDCGLRTDRLIAAIAAILGVDPDPKLLPDMRLNAPELAISAFRLRLESLLAEHPRGLPTDAEDKLYSGVATLIARYGPTAAVLRSDDLSNRAILRAVGAMAREGGATPTMAQICQQVGVSRTRLFDCFAAELGIAPGQFLIHQRLGTVRDALLRRDGPCRSVKEVMLAHGIRNGGRFAATYRALYGENPNDTLARAGKSYNAAGNR
ncbi:AraC family transcriptional regulator [Pseudoruegeria sp. SHC-113]|uniref:AraC family transcriptional regulator n=1 Tax=Pseudoruegeria sp. SHC-113 TaxID=2855439 RepID=UPI0021BA7FB2|nr:helix-turn-helix domain-containing protein [Pseudoruegeria sp. SHC-113]MCT8161479.1 helix-turn-helix domain-containing protein [Pseudoruegeria sp. SHC-113]